MKQPANNANAERLRSLIRQLGNYGHVDVRAHAQHLIVELIHDSEREPVARATRLDSQTFGLSFPSHTGRWEPMPVSGGLEEIARAMTEELGAYIDPSNL
jgi:hypothetical protein